MLKAPALVLALFVGAAAQAMDSPDVGVPWLYPGFAVLAFVWSAADSFGIGANDVANSFSTAVASGTLNHRQAVVVALLVSARVTGHADAEANCPRLVSARVTVHADAEANCPRFTEFTGAVVLGASVTDTVRKKVIVLDRFENDPAKGFSVTLE
ncbi:hypothetical protein T484DRAFT_1791476 [Baffinella frigidus]|nr:hypothetical protein T484DRAFT_1791476 [Cryptophyta sp. CCMP2293]